MQQNPAPPLAPEAPEVPAGGAEDVRPPQLSGAIEAVEAGVVRGWVQGAAPGRALALYVARRRIATGLAEEGDGGGRAAFALDARGCPPDLLGADELAIDVAVLGEPSRRIASTRVATAAFLTPGDLPVATRGGPLEGCIDEQGPDRVRGWIRDGSRPDRHVELFLFSGERYLGRHLAAQPRPDLAATGRAHGNYGFDIPLRGVVEPLTLVAGAPEHWRIPLAAHAVSSSRSVAPAPRRELPDSFEGYARLLTAAEPFPKKAFVIDGVKQGAVPDPFSADYVLLALDCLRAEMAAAGERAGGGGLRQHLRHWAEMRAIGTRMRRLEELAAAIVEAPRLLEAAAAKRRRGEDG